MDIAHTGAYSLYVDAIQRADRLCAELWSAIQSDPEYKDRTTLYILPRLWPRCRRRSRRQRFSTSPHRERRRAYHLDARPGTARSSERDCRPPNSVGRPGPDTGMPAWIFYTVQHRALHRGARMTPANLSVHDFARYGPEARSLALGYWLCFGCCRLRSAHPSCSRCGPSKRRSLQSVARCVLNAMIWRACPGSALPAHSGPPRYRVARHLTTYRLGERPDRTYHGDDGVALDKRTDR